MTLYYCKCVLNLLVGIYLLQLWIVLYTHLSYDSLCSMLAISYDKNVWAFWFLSDLIFVMSSVENTTANVLKINLQGTIFDWDKIIHVSFPTFIILCYLVIICNLTIYKIQTKCKCTKSIQLTKKAKYIDTDVYFWYKINKQIVY